MKITIEPEIEEECKKIVLDSVYQFALCGFFINEKLCDDKFKINIISHHNDLLGLIRSTELDVLDHKDKTKNKVKSTELDILDHKDKS